MRRQVVFVLILTGAVAIAAFVWLRSRPRPTNDMKALAERYVRLVLALGQHDPAFVDAYYGPAEWRVEAQHAKVPLTEVDAAATDLASDLDVIAPPASADELVRWRHAYVARQLEALRARVAMVRGTRLRFDEESKALYDATSPQRDAAQFLAVLAELEARLPGSGPLAERYETFRSRFVIPRDRLDATFRAAIDGCRSRTLKHIRMPSDESFTVEYVSGKSWGAYNWYKGGYRSVIQVNTDLPIHADYALVLACHEGYPGHHVYNALLEKNFVRDRRWPEFSVYALFSPQSLIAEGTADFGIHVAFPGRERVAFAQSVIFPAAGLDPATAATYYEVADLAAKLDYAGDEAARRYLDGQIDAAGAAAWLEKYALYSRPRAEQRIRFFDEYRSYTINYTVGEDLVEQWVESRGGTESDPERRWEVFADLLSSPRLPSDLVR
jgi:hypothetical protein